MSGKAIIKIMFDELEKVIQTIHQTRYSGNRARSRYRLTSNYIAVVINDRLFSILDFKSKKVIYRVNGVVHVESMKAESTLAVDIPADALLSAMSLVVSETLIKAYNSDPLAWLMAKIENIYNHSEDLSWI